MESLWPAAFDQACVFVSCVKVDTSPEVLKQRFESWWDEIGKNMFWNSPADLEEEEDEEEMDEEPEEEGADELGEKSESQDFANCLASAQKNMLLAEELKDLAEDPNLQPPSDDVRHLDSDFEDEDSGEEKVVEQPGQQWELDLNIFTLADVLTEYGFDVKNLKLGAVLDSNRQETKMMKSMRVLVKITQRFVVLVRKHEGILTKAQVTGMKRAQNRHNLLEHELGLARTAFQCFATNQSRQAMWQGFSERVLKDLAENLEVETVAGARYLSKVGPVSSGGAESRQLVVVRPFSAGEGNSGGLRLGIPTAVWRCGRNKQRAGQPKLVADGKIPIHYCQKLHVKLLSPYFDQTTQTLYFIGSCLGLG